MVRPRDGTLDWSEHTDKAHLLCPQHLAPELLEAPVFEDLLPLLLLPVLLHFLQCKFQGAVLVLVLSSAFGKHILTWRSVVDPDCRRSSGQWPQACSNTCVFWHEEEGKEMEFRRERLESASMLGKRFVLELECHCKVRVASKLRP